MNYRRHQARPQMRVITVKYDGECHCCGATIKAGQMASYYPAGMAGPKGVIAHMGGLEGTGGPCTANIRERMELVRDPGEDAADRWNEMHGDR
jgi:hypothetical protein